MKKLLIISACLLMLVSRGRAQDLGNFGDVPVEINAENTRFVGGLAIAEDNVVIRYGGATIYSNYAQYDPDTRDVLVTGDVRIYQQGRVFLGERAVYNLETKQLHGADFRGDFFPYHFSGENLTSFNPQEFKVRNGVLTTSDSSRPDYFIRGKSIRIYPNNRIVFVNVTLYVGNTPVFWFPYLYQPLQKNTGYTILPTYQSIWGAALLGTYTFPMMGDLLGMVHFDMYSSRGVGIGFDSHGSYGPGEKSWYRFKSYYIDDAAPGTNKTNFSRETIDPQRYRFSLQDRNYFTDDIYSSVDLNKLSDAKFLQDFYRVENRLDPEPDNVASLTKWDENYTLTATVRGQLNEFFDTTERLPEFALDEKTQPLFHSGIFYDGQTSLSNLRFQNEKDSPFPNYQSFRLDSFHQLSMPETLFGFLSFIPRLGVRGTVYNKTGQATTESPDPSQPLSLREAFSEQSLSNKPAFRPSVEGGFESSFKLSRFYDGVESRAWGLDGLLHVIQPYTDLSMLYAGKNPGGILQFDRFIPSDQLPVFDFPQFTAIDSIANWAIWRFGVNNRLETKRDNQTITWFELNTFFDVNLIRPKFPGNALSEGTFSNLYNTIRWAPLSWLSFNANSQIPLSKQGFTELNTGLSFMINRNTRIDLGNRYINHSPDIFDDNEVTFGGYYRVNDNWALSIHNDYNITTSTMQTQRYYIHRDLSSWIASLEVLIDNNGGGSVDYGVVLNFTLKDAPQINVGSPELDPESLTSSGKND